MQAPAHSTVVKCRHCGAIFASPEQPTHSEACPLIPDSATPGASSASTAHPNASQPGGAAGREPVVRVEFWGEPEDEAVRMPLSEFLDNFGDRMTESEIASVRGLAVGEHVEVVPRVPNAAQPDRYCYCVERLPDADEGRELRRAFLREWDRLADKVRARGRDGSADLSELDRFARVCRAISGGLLVQTPFVTGCGGAW